MLRNTRRAGQQTSRARALLAWMVLVAHRGFEPLISALRGRCPGPLDECAVPLRIANLGRTGQGSARAPQLASVILAIASAGLLAAACNSGSHDAPVTSPLTPDLTAVMSQVAAIRNLPPATGVRVGAITREQVPATLASTLTENDRESFAHLTTLYRLLGHLGPTEDYQGAYLAFAGGNVIGFYSPRDKSLFVVTSDGEPIDFSTLEILEQSTIAHELTHALQDHAFDVQSLFAKTKDDLDWTLALSAVIEGDAVNVEGMWRRDHAYAPPPAPLRAAVAAAELPLARSVGRGGGGVRAQSTPVSIEREFRFPYTTGAEWVSIVRSQHRADAIDTVLRGRRLTTAEIIHPDLYENGFTPDSVSLPDVAKALGDGWTHESGGAFGEFQLRNYLQLELTALPATQAATGWRGDRYDVYRKRNDSVAVFRLRFASAGEAQEFVGAQGAFFEGAKAAVSHADGRWLAVFPDGRTTVRADAAGPDVIFVIGSNETVAQAAFAALSNG